MALRHITHADGSTEYVEIPAEEVARSAARRELRKAKAHAEIQQQAAEKMAKDNRPKLLAELKRDGISDALLTRILENLLV